MTTVKAQFDNTPYDVIKDLRHIRNDIACINEIKQRILENVQAVLTVVIAEHFNRKNIAFPRQNPLGFNYYCSGSDCSPEFQPYLIKVKNIYTKHLGGEYTEDRNKVEKQVRKFLLQVSYELLVDLESMTKQMDNWKCGVFVTRGAIQVFFQDRAYQGNPTYAYPGCKVAPKDGTEVVGYDTSKPKLSRVFSVSKQN